ncbi:MAG: DMT family transporter [Paracoccaceae bacterium]
MTNLNSQAMLILAAFFWGTGNVAQKTVLTEIGPLTAVGLRCLIASIVLLPVVWHELPKAQNFARRNLGSVAVVVVLFAAAICLQQLCYAGTSVSNASFLISTTTVMTPFISWWACNSRPAAAIWLAVLCTFTGIILIAGGSIANLSWGDFVCLCSAFLYAMWFVALGRLVGKVGTPGLITLAQFLFAGCLFLGLGISLETVGLAQIFSVLPHLLYLGVFATGFAYGLQAMAQQRVSANVAAVLTSSESVFGVGAAAVLLGEHIKAPMFLGGILILVAISLVQVSPNWTCRAKTA